mgnify:CR=1 FL=1
MKTKAILIDPNLPRISVERVDGFEDIQRMIGCRCFTCVRFPDGKHVAFGALILFGFIIALGILLGIQLDDNAQEIQQSTWHIAE